MLGTSNGYIGGDHAWGGGGDVKYFFCRYAGIGVEGFALDADKPGFNIFEDQSVPILIKQRINHSHTIGALFRDANIAVSNSSLGSRLMHRGGVGAIFGGGERDQLHTQGPPDAFAVNAEPTILAARPKCSPNSGPVSKFASRATSVELTT